MSRLAGVKAAVEAANEAGVPPGEIAQAVLERCHEMDPVPFGSREDCRLTTIAEDTGEIAQKVMKPSADYVVTTGPDYEVAGEVVYPGTGTTVLTIKRRKP